MFVENIFRCKHVRGIESDGSRSQHERYDFKLKKAAWGFILAVMMVPTQVFAIGYYKFMIQLKLIEMCIRDRSSFSSPEDT